MQEQIADPNLNERGYGMPIGRPERWSFDPKFYKSYYPKVSGLTDIAARMHFYTFGKFFRRIGNLAAFTHSLERNGKTLPGDFDPNQYLILNPDLRTAFSHPWQAVQHYIEHGHREGRATLCDLRAQRQGPLVDVALKLSGAAPGARVLIAVSHGDAPTAEFARRMILPPEGWQAAYRQIDGFQHALEGEPDRELVISLSPDEKLTVLKQPGGGVLRVRVLANVHDASLESARMETHQIHISDSAPIQLSAVENWKWISTTGALQAQAIELGHLAPDIQVLAACVPRWRGVAASTLALFDNVVFFPGTAARDPADIQEDEIEAFSRAIADKPPRHFVVSGGDAFMLKVSQHLGKIAPAIDIHLLWHSNFLQLGEGHDAALLLGWIGLCRSGRVRGILTVRKHFDDYLRSLGVSSQYLPNVIAARVARQASIPPDHGRKSIGLWLSGSSEYRKRPHAALFAARLLQDRGFDIHAAGLGPEGLALAQALGLNSGLMSATPLPRDELMQRMSKTDVTAYVTVSECAPMLPLESWSVGVPAIIGPSCRYYEENPFLRAALVVENPSSPTEIADKIAHVANNSEEIMRQLDSYYLRVTETGAASLGAYLSRGTWNTAASRSWPHKSPHIPPDSHQPHFSMIPRLPHFRGGGFGYGSADRER